MSTRRRPLDQRQEGWGRALSGHPALSTAQPAGSRPGPTSRAAARSASVLLSAEAAERGERTPPGRA